MIIVKRSETPVGQCELHIVLNYE